MTLDNLLILKTALAHYCSCQRDDEYVRDILWKLQNEIEHRQARKG